MLWNLFETIINAVRPKKESIQPPDEQQQWNETGSEQAPEQHEHTSSVQEPQNTSEQNNW